MVLNTLAPMHYYYQSSPFRLVIESYVLPVVMMGDKAHNTFHKFTKSSGTQNNQKKRNI